MGMFDNVIIAYPLPDDEHLKCSGWQTKDFDCDVDTYLIREDGQLCKSKLSRDVKSFSPYDYNGIIWVYTYSEDRFKDKSTQHLFVEFKLEFEDGKVIPESVMSWPPTHVKYDDEELVAWSEEEKTEFLKKCMLAISKPLNYGDLLKNLIKVTPLEGEDG